MFYTLGLFVQSTERRRAARRRVDRWCIITGPHYRRQEMSRRRELTIELAGHLAKTADYDLESVITVREEELPKYEVTTFPWLLMQSTFWEKE